MAVFENGSWRTERWYRFQPTPFSPALTDEDAAEQLLDIYKRALKRHLISDVPVGLMLSGGVDSGLLLGLMRLYGDAWPTYTVGYGKTAFKDDELTDAAETAALFSSRNCTIMLNRETFEESLPQIVAMLEEPIAASSIVPMYFVCERARQDVKVALVGQGPDELVRRLQAPSRRAVRLDAGGGFRGGYGPAFMKGSRHLPRHETLKRGVYSLDVEDRLQRYQNVFSILPGDDVDACSDPDCFRNGAGDSIRESWADLAPEMEGCDELGAFQVLEIRSSLPDELLMYADKLSMAHGLEVRVPYLDKEVVEFAERLPARFKIRGRSTQMAASEGLRGIPSSRDPGAQEAGICRQRRGHMVQRVPRQPHGTLSSRRRIVDVPVPQRPSRFAAWSTNISSGRNDNHKMLFSLIVFEEWLRGNDSAGRNTRPLEMAEA